jgi:acyl carrier protein
MAECVSLVTRIFSEKLLLDIPSPETDLLDSGLLDSMVFVELLLNLEREFGMRVTIEDLDMESFRSISRIAELVESTNGRAGAAGHP